MLLAEVDDVRKLAARRVRVFFREDVIATPPLPAGHVFEEKDPRVWQLRVEGLLGPLLDLLSALPVADIAVEEPRLEDVLIQYYREGTP